MLPLPILLAITGASGAIYGKKLLETLLATGREIHLTISPSATQVFQHELDLSIDLHHFDPSAWTQVPTDRLVYWHYQNFMAGIASGSFRTAGMVICPCSMSTLAKIAGGQGDNLIHRAADVHLKERRKLILVPRETPLSPIGIENMLTVTRAGAVVLPAMPGFYHRPATIDDLVDFVVARICDQLDVDAGLGKRWGEISP